VRPRRTRRWREAGLTTPILFLPACDDVADRVRGLDLGGDDYLVKPFAFEELLARVRALVRRGPATQPAPELRVGDLVIGELRTLVTLLNDMRARIEGAFATQRRFVADASHELRSPLSNLRGTIEVALRHTRTAGDYQETLGVALTELERLARLVQGLLTLSRADAGRLTLERRSVDLAEVAARAIGMHATRAAARDVHLQLDAGAPAPVHGDTDRLREVVDNLLDNALRVAPRGSTVRVGVTHADGRCVVEVEDTGPGLTQEEQAHVFEPFARGAAPGGDGAGLGLAIARTVVQAHGGHLGVRSAPGSGATFRLELPAGANGAQRSA
jgi:two-component system OmpR family sensor kinase